MSRLLSIAGVVAILAVAECAFAAGDGSDLPALKKQRDELSQTVNAKQKELSDLRSAVYKGEQVAPLQAKLQAAFKLVSDKQHSDPDVQAARKAADEANQARDAVVTAEVAADAEGSVLLKQIEATNAQIKASQEAIRVAQQRLGDVRRRVEKESAKVAAAQTTVKQANDTYQQVSAKKTADERAAEDKARSTVDAKANEVLAGDAHATALRKEIDELQKKDHELSQKIRELEKAAAKPDAKTPESKTPDAKKKDQPNK